MQAFSVVLLILGGLGILIGAIGLLMAGFREGTLWGIGILLMPIVTLIFVATHWDDAKGSFVLQLVGGGLFAAGLAISPTPLA